MRIFVRHSLFWLAIYLVWTYIRASDIHYMMYLQVNLVQVSIYMMAYYTLKHWQIPYLYNRGKIVQFILSLIGVSIVFYLLWRTMGILWLDELRGLKTTASFFKFSAFLRQTVQVYSPAMILLAWEMQYERKQEQRRIQQLEKEKLATELKFLKAQINPHFLFNTLNNLYSNVVNKSPHAPDMIMRLSGLLDYVLYRSQKKTVPLSEEVNTIENFLGLEKIRYGDRLQVDYQSDKNLSLPISPLILLSLVENAFKHGASGDIDEPKIKINIKENNGSILCNVWNTKSKYQGELNDAYKNGIDITNIKRQLNLVYPDSHQLVINNSENAFDVLLTIKPSAQ